MHPLRIIRDNPAGGSRTIRARMMPSYLFTDWGGQSDGNGRAAARRGTSGSEVADGYRSTCVNDQRRWKDS